MAQKRKLAEEPEPCDPVISLQDVIDEDAELETTANAVLGGSNDQECTYLDGYLPRQALYACVTCETCEEAGVCLACSLECHDGHELFELYTKRDFRCDCGNSKFPKLTCALNGSKDPTNPKNTYNQNFKGTYCTCMRPYPDPEDDVEDEMIQCIVCEDWFHSRHLLGQAIPEGSDYAEMICHVCMQRKCQFLWYYNWEFTPHETSVVDIISHSQEQEPEENGHESVAKPESKSVLDASKSNNSDESNIEKQGNERVENLNSKLLQETSNADSVKAQSQEKLTSDKKTVNPTTTIKKFQDFVDIAEERSEQSKERCILHRLMKLYGSCQFPNSASFWPDGWREKLCACAECQVMMKELTFLYRKDDTVAEYEKRGSRKNSSSSLGMNLLGGMSRIQQVEVIHGYNNMKAELMEYLRTFADENRVVTEEDIRNFFQRMTASKKLKVDIPHSCR